MSNQRGLVISIAGAPVSIGTHASLTGAAGYAATVRPVIVSVPPAQTLSIDPETGALDAGGMSVRCRDLSELLTQFKADPKTSLVNEESKTSVTWDVEDITGFTPPFTAWIGQEAVQVGGVSAGPPAQFTAITRGTLGTTAQRHRPGKKVYSYMPNLEGRQCLCEWIDLITLARTTRYKGIIERVEFDGELYTLVITSVLKGVQDRKVLRKQFAQGALTVDLPEAGAPDFYIQCDDKARVIPGNTNTGYDKSYVLIEEEILLLQQVIYPAESNTVVNLLGTTRLEVSDNIDIQTGWMVDILTAGGAIRVEGAMCVGRSTATATTVYLDFNTNLAAVIATDVVTANYHVLVPGLRMKRGMFGTKQAAHAAGAKVDELRILEGNQIDILLRLMFSDKGDGSNGPASGAYDYYPEDWGLALPSDQVDLAALLDLKVERSEHRLYKQQESIAIPDLLRLIGNYCNAAIYWREDGALTATIRRDIYPRDTAPQAITRSVDNQDQKSTATVDLSLIRNFWEVKTDWDTQGERFGHVITIEDVDSSDLRGQIPMEEVEDKGLIKSVCEAQIYTAAKSFLILRAHPLLIVKTSVHIIEGIVYRPGQLVTVDLPELPNLQGGEGVLSTFEILEVAPDDGTGYQDLVMMERPSFRKLGYIALCGRVESLVGGTDFRIEAAAVSHFAPASPLFEPPGGAGVPGTEDIEWFLLGDNIKLWDVSTFGAGGLPTTASTVIDAINYATRDIRPAVLPPWLAAGDLVTLDIYTAVKGGAVGGDRVDIFLAIAAGATSPALIDGDESFKWGM